MLRTHRPGNQASVRRESHTEIYSHKTTSSGEGKPSAQFLYINTLHYRYF